MLDAMMNQRGIKLREQPGVFKHDIRGVFTLADTPVIRQSQWTSEFRRQGVTLVEDRFQKTGPMALQLFASQCLSLFYVLDPSETVLALLISYSRCIHLARQPVTAIDTDAYLKRKPRLQPQMHKT